MQVALFRVRDLSSPKIRYKIDVNAQQYGLTGAVLSCRDPAFGEQGIHLVVVEGGPRAIRRSVHLIPYIPQKNGGIGDGVHGCVLSWRCILGGCRYVKLMLKRIKWDAKEEHDEEDDDDDDEDEEDYAAGSGGSSKCELIWKGTVHKASFNGFKFQVSRMPPSLHSLCRRKLPASIASE